MALPGHETLKMASRRYRLRDPRMHNSEIAKHLGVGNRLSLGPFTGLPACFFYVRWSILEDATVVAVRVTDDELAILGCNEYILGRVTGIADEITADESEEIHA